MSRVYPSKINKITNIRPLGSVLTMSWLKSHGVSHRLAWRYVKSGWLHKISAGAYLFAGDKLSWAGAASAVQQQLCLDAAIGAKSAFEFIGSAHYLRPNSTEIYIFSLSSFKAPKWLLNGDWQGKNFKVINTKLFSSIHPSWNITKEVEGQTLLISSPEKAALELCSLIPSKITFAEASLIMENQSRMRPKMLQGLLEQCNSFKAKRLLLYFGDLFNHSWVSEIDFSKINLGKGKQVIAGGGLYSAKYMISVPPLEQDS